MNIWPNGRHICIQAIQRYRYDNLSHFFQRYLQGENFDYEKLRDMGYNEWDARNLDAYINHSHDPFYADALTW